MTVRMTMQQRGGSEHTIRALKAAAKTAAEEVVSLWHERYMPAHFAVAGGKKYGYQPRSGDNEPPRLPRGKPGSLGAQRYKSNNHYSWRKRRQKGHNKPLVWSGETERLAKLASTVSSRFVKAEGVVRATVALPYLPKYFYQYRQGTPNKVDELTRVSADEVSALQSAYAANFDRSLEAQTAASSLPSSTTATL